MSNKPPRSISSKPNVVSQTTISLMKDHLLSVPRLVWSLNCDTTLIFLAATYVQTDTRYMFECCGVVTQWSLFAKNTGNIRLQIWRPTGSSMKLVGENEYAVLSSMLEYILSIIYISYGVCHHCEKLSGGKYLIAIR